MNQNFSRSSVYFPNDLFKVPHSIGDSIDCLKAFALQEFDQEVAQKQLYYHTRDHLENVRRRATQILQAVYPFSETSSRQGQSFELSRIELLLDLCVAAHDMVQVFVDHPNEHTSRQRESGVSEQATIDRLLDYIDELNQQLRHDPDSQAIVTDDDIAVIQEAIKATICTYDPIERAIYQADLYNFEPPVSIVARILALADIGALGIDGIDAYSQEGSLLFLEENLDVIPLLLDGTIYHLESDHPLYKNIQQRLLKRCRFQVNFAKSRAARFESEIEGLPEDVRSTLTRDVFRYLTPTTVQAVAAITPTDEATPLESLLKFFEFERHLDPSRNTRPQNL